MLKSSEWGRPAAEHQLGTWGVSGSGPGLAICQPCRRSWCAHPRPRPLRPASKEQGMGRGQRFTQVAEGALSRWLRAASPVPSHADITCPSSLRTPQPHPRDEAERGSSPLSSSPQAPAPGSNHEAARDTGRQNRGHSTKHL